MNSLYEKGNNPLLDKSLELALFFAGKITEYKEEDNYSIKSYLSQISRSSSSIPANVAEAQPPITAKHKYSKLNIAFGECYETRMFIEILHKANILSETEYLYTIGLCDEIGKMLNRSLYNLNQKINDSNKKTKTEKA